MIGVTVSDKNCIESLKTKLQRLLSKVGGSVDQDSVTCVFNDDGNAKPFISRIVRNTRIAFAANGRNAGGSACAEKRELHLSVQIRFQLLEVRRQRKLAVRKEGPEGVWIERALVRRNAPTLTRGNFNLRESEEKKSEMKAAGHAISSQRYV